MAATPSSEDFDAISLSIMWDRLVAIADEIVSTLVRTSFSTIVRDSYDLSVVILDTKGRLIAQGTYAVPVFIGTAPRTLRYMLERFPPETLRPGDIIATNDPWIGTGHMFDISMMRPIFIRQQLVGYTMSITHLPDIGGLGFGAAAREIYHEGLRLPICRFAKDGVMDPFIEELIRTNVRVPEQTIGDLMANIACNEVGGPMVTAFMAEYRLDSLEPLSDAIGQHSERAMRAKLGEIADGRYENRIDIEGTDGPIPMACSVEIKGSDVVIDFTGTGGCVPRGINVPFCYTNAMALYTMKCLTIPGLPNNSGAVIPITVSAPEGCLLNAQPPFPTGGRHAIGHFVPGLIFGALAEAAPDKIQADCGMMDLMTVQGTHRDGRGISTIYFASGGFGALQGADGGDCVPGPSNMAVVPVEVWETITGTTVEKKAMIPDSGGPGAWRGGAGQEVVLRNDTGYPLTIFCMANRTEYPPLGYLGGKPGARRVHRLNGQEVDAKGSYILAPGDRIAMTEAGGGGIGDPRDRDPALIERDITLGRVTLEGATRDYGYQG
jgi:N-methylhydantoinase B